MPIYSVPAPFSKGFPSTHHPPPPGGAGSLSLCLWMPPGPAIRSVPLLDISKAWPQSLLDFQHALFSIYGSLKVHMLGVSPALPLGSPPSGSVQAVCTRSELLRALGSPFLVLTHHQASAATHLWVSLCLLASCDTWGTGCCWPFVCQWHVLCLVSGNKVQICSCEECFLPLSNSSPLLAVFAFTTLAFLWFCSFRSLTISFLNFLSVFRTLLILISWAVKIDFRL